MVFWWNASGTVYYRSVVRQRDRGGGGVATIYGFKVSFTPPQLTFSSCEDFFFLLGWVVYMFSLFILFASHQLSPLVSWFVSTRVYYNCLDINFLES